MGDALQGSFRRSDRNPLSPFSLPSKPIFPSDFTYYFITPRGFIFPRSPLPAPSLSLIFDLFLPTSIFRCHVLLLLLLQLPYPVCSSRLPRRPPSAAPPPACHPYSSVTSPEHSTGLRGPEIQLTPPTLFSPHINTFRSPLSSSTETRGRMKKAPKS